MPPLSDLDAQKIVDYFKDRHIPSGLGDKEEACSIAGINLALSGELTDEIPECMSFVIGKWIIAVQDEMPDAMRNSTEWKALLPLAAGTGREHEAERAAIVLDWMWSVLAYLQPLADEHGFGDAWRTMCDMKTKQAADAAAVAAKSEGKSWAASAAASVAAAAAAAAAEWAEWAWAAEWAAAASVAAVAAKSEAAATKSAAKSAAAKHQAWAAFDPCALLARLIQVD